MRNPGPIVMSNPVAAHPLNQGREAWWLAVGPSYGGPTWRDLTGRYAASLASFGSSSGFRATTRPGGWGQLLLTNNNAASAPAFALSGSFVLSAWVLCAGSSRGVIGSRGSADNSFDWQISNGGWHADIGTGSGYLTTAANTTGVTLVSGRWYRGLLIADSVRSTWSWFVNGVAAGSGTMTAGTPLLADATHTLSLGNIGSSYTSYSLSGSELGALDDVAVWSARSWAFATPSQFAALDYDQSVRGYPDALRRASPRTTVLFGSPSPVFRPWFSNRDLSGGLAS